MNDDETAAATPHPSNVTAWERESPSRWAIVEASVAPRWTTGPSRPTEAPTLIEAALTTADLLYLVQRLGKVGAETEQRTERSALYGDFLSRCAECHTLTGGGPTL